MASWAGWSGADKPNQKGRITMKITGRGHDKVRHADKRDPLKSMKRLLVAGVVVGSIAVSGGVAFAHNAGHVILADGTCINVGSGESAPFVGAKNPHYHTAADVDLGRLDLIPGPGDQFGARFAATRGHSAVLPGSCP